MLTKLENWSTVEEKRVTQWRNRDSADNATRSEIEDRWLARIKLDGGGAVIQKIIKNNWKTQRVVAAYGHCLFTGAHNFLGFYRNRAAQSGLIRANKYWIVAARKGRKRGRPKGEHPGEETIQIGETGSYDFGRGRENRGRERSGASSRLPRASCRPLANMKLFKILS